MTLTKCFLRGEVNSEAHSKQVEERTSRRKQSKQVCREGSRETGQMWRVAQHGARPRACVHLFVCLF